MLKKNYTSPTRFQTFLSCKFALEISSKLCCQWNKTLFQVFLLFLSENLFETKWRLSTTKLFVSNFKYKGKYETFGFKVTQMSLIRTVLTTKSGSVTQRMILSLPEHNVVIEVVAGPNAGDCALRSEAGFDEGPRVKHAQQQVDENLQR